MANESLQSNQVLKYQALTLTALPIVPHLTNDFNFENISCLRPFDRSGVPW